MSKEKQIAEIARDFNKGMCSDRESVESCAECVGASEHCLLYEIATKLYNAGYRKQSGAGLMLTFDGATGYFPKAFIIEAIRTHMKKSNGRKLADEVCRLSEEITLLINERDEARRDCGMAERNHRECVERVQDLHIQLDAMRGSANSYKRLYEELKEEHLTLIKGYAEMQKDYAKEIFEEIENRAFGFGACFVEMTRTTFDELKNKYTEGVE